MAWLGVLSFWGWQSHNQVASTFVSRARSGGATGGSSDIFAPLANASLGVASAYGAGDGIHLNDGGHARIFEVAEAIVKPYVCSRVACR